MKNISYKIYQSMRFYLDEYSEQVELRKEFLSKDNYLLYKNSFGQTSLLFEGVSDYIEIPDTNDFYFDKFFSEIRYTQMLFSEPYFYNRWIRRN